MKNKQKELERKYHSKDLNIAYNDGIQKGRQIERDEIRKKIEAWNRNKGHPYPLRISKDELQEFLNSLGEK